MAPNFSSFQANILKSHGRNFVVYLFLRFKNPTLDPGLDIPNKLREWIQLSIGDKITSHKRQLEQTQSFLEEEVQEPIFGFALSNNGFKKLGISANFHPKDEAFQRGMNAIGTIARLQDYTGINLEQFFRKIPNDSYHIPLDAVLMVGHDQLEIINSIINKIEEENLFKACIFHSFRELGFRGGTISQRGKSLSPLRFADGLSNKRNILDIFQNTAVKEFSENHFGSYMVFRKTRVNSNHFDRMLSELSNQLPEKDLEYLAALLMGRFRDGTPLALFEKRANETEWRTQNLEDKDFDYEHDKSGNLCPIHAHVRAVNPRTPSKKLPPIVRRSMNFSKFQSMDISEINQHTDGLHFVSFQKSISQQFEPLFKNMKQNRDMIAYRPKPGRKAIIQSFSKNYGDTKKVEGIAIGGRSLTQFLGGEYFYLPSTHFLKNLDNFLTPSPNI